MQHGVLRDPRVHESRLPIHALRWVFLQQLEDEILRLSRHRLPTRAFESDGILLRSGECREVQQTG